MCIERYRQVIKRSVADQNPKAYQTTEDGRNNRFIVYGERRATIAMLVRMRKHPILQGEHRESVIKRRVGLTKHGRQPSKAIVAAVVNIFVA